MLKKILGVAALATTFRHNRRIGRNDKDRGDAGRARSDT